MKQVKALKGEKELHATISKKENEELLGLAYSTIIQYLGDNVLRQFVKEKTAARVWLKLEQLYMTKTLIYSVYLKGRLFGLKMTEDKSLDERFDKFTKIVIYLKIIRVKVEGEDQQSWY